MQHFRLDAFQGIIEKVGIDLFCQELYLGLVLLCLLLLDADHLPADGVVHRVDGRAELANLVIVREFQFFSVAVLLDLVDCFHQPVDRAGDVARHEEGDRQQKEYQEQQEQQEGKTGLAENIQKCFPMGIVEQDHIPVAQSVSGHIAVRADEGAAVRSVPCRLVEQFLCPLILKDR